MEMVYWLDWEHLSSCPDSPRLYLGHETSADKMPALQDIADLARRGRTAGQSLTLVTPFLTEKSFDLVCGNIEALANLLGQCEVVCNDWGLLHWLSECQIAEPILGRFLVGQAVDPRLAAFDQPERQLPYQRWVRHADGTPVHLRYSSPAKALMTHVRRCAIDTPETLAFLQQLGVRRLEISNLLQGIELTLAPGWQVTLHLPEVPIAVARQRLQEGETQWLHPSFPVPLYCRDNVIYYCHNTLPPQEKVPFLDRLVYRLRSDRNGALPFGQ